MTDKYEFTGETKVVLGITLRQIRALIAIPLSGVSVGDVGGWIEKEENLSQASDSAWISGHAQISGNARIYDNARISGNAQISGGAWISGHAQISGNAWIYDNARIYGKAWIYGDARIYGNAQIYGGAWISGNAQIYGNAWIYGIARISGHAWIYGDARIYKVNVEATRTDGYTFTVAPTPNGPRVIAGCRYLTFKEAKAHWKASRSGTKLGDETMSILKHLETMAKINGFMEPVA